MQAQNPVSLVWNWYTAQVCFACMNIKLLFLKLGVRAQHHAWVSEWQIKTVVRWLRETNTLQLKKAYANRQNASKFRKHY